MLEEIPFEDGKIVFIKEANFWQDILERCKKESKSIDIATYNFNFNNKYEKSFYTKLSELADLGVEIRLLYALMTFSEEDKLDIEEVFKNFVLCAHLPENHSKIFITNDFAFIGSANFSFNSDKNYECGVIFTNKEIISKIRKVFGTRLLEVSKFKNVPQAYFSPFAMLPTVINAVEKLNGVEKKKDLYEYKLQETIPLLRYLDDMEKDLKKIDYTIPRDIDWVEFYVGIEGENSLSDKDFRNFQAYIHKLLLFLLTLKDYIQEQYNSIGKNEFIKKMDATK